MECRSFADLSLHVFPVRLDDGLSDAGKAGAGVAAAAAAAAAVGGGLLVRHVYKKRKR